MPVQNTLPDPYHNIDLMGNVGGSYGPGFSDVTLKSSMPIMQAKLNSRVLDSKNAYHHKWEISISYNSLTRAEFNIVYAFLAWKKITMEPFYIAVPPYFSQTGTGINTIYGEVKGVEKLTVSNMGAISIDDIFTLNEKAYKVTRKSAADQYGVGTINISPNLQADALINSNLIFLNPVFKVKQMNDSLDYTINDQGLYSFSLTIEEAV